LELPRATVCFHDNDDMDAAALEVAAGHGIQEQRFAAGGDDNDDGQVSSSFPSQASRALS